jgi:hypothetical protein
VRDNVSLEECRKAVSAQMPAEDKVAFMWNDVDIKTFLVMKFTTQHLLHVY